ncbi:radical SAM (seleno)protein TrsS [uncultured Desulfovibrio sp.]|uniref:radical SAM (seleno)protein TrsS n=1 Tax=uncultured Desulfovibrio sp. TaxID=167968 RepID=UPI00345ABC56
MLRRTQSLCPVCLRRLDAVYEHAPDGAAVLLRKRCPEHGAFSVPVWREPQEGGPSTPAFADWSRPKAPSYPARPATSIAGGCPFDCGLCPAHAQHTCTGLVEVTLRCNMACPVCYAGAGAEAVAGDPPPAVVAARLDALRQASGPCNVQISGGEPTVRDDLPAILSLARQRGFGLVQLNTNGLRLAEDPEYAARLRAAGLDSVYLQWDGAREASFLSLRGRECLAFKRRAVEHCARAGLGVVLVATVVRGVNSDELGELLRLALRLGPAVRGLHLQPAAFFGRYPWRLEQAPRLTLPEVMGALAQQAPELFSPGHVHPPGCEHELCSFSAAYRRTERQGAPALEPLGQAACCAPAPQAPFAPPPAAEGARQSRRFTALHWKGSCPAPKPSGRESAAADGFSRFLAEAGAERRFTLSAMAFQDALSLDVDRVRGCCIHVARPDGRLIPFCLHNITSADGTRLYGGGR